MLKPLRWYLWKYGNICQKCDWDYDEWCAGFELEVEWCADENSFGLEKSGVRQNVKSDVSSATVDPGENIKSLQLYGEIPKAASKEQQPVA